MGEINRREIDAQILRLFFISTAAFIVIGAVIYGVFQTEKILLMSLVQWFKFCRQLVFQRYQNFSNHCKCKWQTGQSQSNVSKNKNHKSPSSGYYLSARWAFSSKGTSRILMCDSYSSIIAFCQKVILLRHSVQTDIKRHPLVVEFLRRLRFLPYSDDSEWDGIPNKIYF